MTATTSIRAPLVRGKMARATLTDQCGMPQIANSMYVTDGTVQVTSTKNMDNGDEIKVRGANGNILVHEPGKSTLLNYTVEIELVQVDPGFLAMITGDKAIIDYTAGHIVGFEELATTEILNHFALEVWTDTSGTACIGSNRLFGYMLYPNLGQAYVTIADISDKEVTATIHAQSYDAPSWGRGPYGATADGSSILGPVAVSAGPPPVPGRLLVAIDPKAHRHFEITPIAPPAAQSTAGPQSITLPTSY